MGRCDELEALRAEREQKRLDAHTAALNALLSAQEPAAFADAWQFMTQHFSDLHSVPKNVTELRKAVLQLAVMGKLVEQDQTDPPASELLTGIDSDKRRLAEESNIRLPEPSSHGRDNIFPFQLPKGWIWCLLEDVSVIGRGGSPRPIEAFITDDPAGINWIKIGDSERGSMYINSTKEKIRKEGLNKTRMVYPGDLILSNSMSFGHPYILNISGCIHDGWLLIRMPPNRIEKIYIYNVFLSPYVKQMFAIAAAGAVVSDLAPE